MAECLWWEKKAEKYREMLTFRGEGSGGVKKEIEVDIKKIRAELAENPEDKVNGMGWRGQGQQCQIVEKRKDEE